MVFSDSMKMGRPAPLRLNKRGLHKLNSFVSGSFIYLYTVFSKPPYIASTQGTPFPFALMGPMLLGCQDCLGMLFGAPLRLLSQKGLGFSAKNCVRFLGVPPCPRFS